MITEEVREVSSLQQIKEVSLDLLKTYILSSFLLALYGMVGHFRFPALVNYTQEWVWFSIAPGLAMFIGICFGDDE